MLLLLFLAQRTVQNHHLCRSPRHAPDRRVSGIFRTRVIRRGRRTMCLETHTPRTRPSPTSLYRSLRTRPCSRSSTSTPSSSFSITSKVCRVYTVALGVICAALGRHISAILSCARIEETVVVTIRTHLAITSSRSLSGDSTKST